MQYMDHKLYIYVEKYEYCNKTSAQYLHQYIIIIIFFIAHTHTQNKKKTCKGIHKRIKSKIIQVKQKYKKPDCNCNRRYHRKNALGWSSFSKRLTLEIL